MNQTTHVDIKFYHDEIKRLQHEDPHHSKIITDMERVKTVSRDQFRLSRNTYKKTRCYEKELTVLIVLEPLWKYIIHESHTSLGHKCTT